MAATVTWVKELAMPEAVDSSNLSSQRKVREWEVLLSAADATGADIAKTGTGIPAIGTQYGSTALRVQTLSAKLKSPSTNRKVYVVTAEYGISETSGGSPVTTDPWDRAVSYSYGSIEYARDLEQDFNPSGAVKVLNTAGDLFAGPIVGRKINLLIGVNYAKKTTDFTPTTAAGYIGTINADAAVINGVTFAAYQVLCRGIRAEQQTWISSGGTETAYYQISYEFEVCGGTTDLHNLKVVSRGYRQLVGGVLTTIKENNKSLPRPSLLNSSGVVTTTPYVQTFWPHPAATWNLSV
jgi:hypothetical protein